jgi:glutamine amidotransferase
VLQSLHARNAVTTTNGDGIGIGWYGRMPEPAPVSLDEPGVERPQPARDRGGGGVAHVPRARALVYGGAVQQTNCHPFRFGKWLFMHNGEIHGWLQVKRDLAMSVDPTLYTSIEGTTDSELMFYLALTFGLEKDPPAPSRKWSASSRRSRARTASRKRSR